MVDRLTLAAVAVLVPLRLYGALVSGVADCDEVYNYWEGVHLLARSDGAFRRPLQTWEYAPNYALRSWARGAGVPALGRASPPRGRRVDAAGWSRRRRGWSR